MCSGLNYLAEKDLFDESDNTLFKRTLVRHLKEQFLSQLCP
jgi:hypothetical protein